MVLENEEYPIVSFKQAFGQLSRNNAFKYQVKDEVAQSKHSRFFLSHSGFESQQPWLLFQKSSGA